MHNSQLSTFNSQLIHWYQQNKRELPWRNTTDPYTIWISEIILQQTRVAQGYEYFLRFIKRFPDIATLALAEEDEVMKYWQGLGYYSRARNLHIAAKSMNGIFPETYQDVLNLKGVGEYTAAAICSISYNMPYAVVDGNVYRVLARYFGIDTPIDSTGGKKEFKELAQELIDKKKPALYNQAIMEFGALQCTPVSPSCFNCPLSASCMAFAQNTVKKLPVKSKKTKTTNRYLNYIYVRAGKYTFIRKRTENDIWKNLFEFPLIETTDPLTEEELYSLPEFSDLLCGISNFHAKKVLSNVKHVLSHRIIYADFYEIVLPEDSMIIGYQRINENDIDGFAVSALVKKFIDGYKK